MCETRNPSVLLERDTPIERYFSSLEKYQNISLETVKSLIIIKENTIGGTFKTLLGIEVVEGIYFYRI